MRERACVPGAEPIWKSEQMICSGPWRCVRKMEPDAQILERGKGEREGGCGEGWLQNRGKRTGYNLNFILEFILHLVLDDTFSN